MYHVAVCVDHNQCSCSAGLQIYNETLHDLFAPPHAKQQSLRLKEDAHGHVAVHGLTEASNTWREH